MASSSVQSILSRAEKYIKKNQLQEAAALYHEIIKKFPTNLRAKEGLAKIEAAKSSPHTGAHSTTKQIDALIAIYNRGKYREALDIAKTMLESHPANADIWNIYGAANRALDDMQAAAKGFQKASQLSPNNSDIYNNLGVSLEDLGQIREAIAAFQRSLSINPNNAATHYNLGNLLNGMGRTQDAITSYTKAITLKPDYERALRALGNIYEQSGNFKKAIDAHQRVLQIATGDTTPSKSALLMLNRCICDWTEAKKYQEVFETFNAAAPAIVPFRMLCVFDDAHRQLLWSKKWAEEKFKIVPTTSPAEPSNTERLRIGYFSSDVQNHATMHLMSGLLRCHDRSQFEIFIYSYGRDKGGNKREETKKVVEHFFDVSDYTDLEISNLAHSHKLDIAIDLKGYTNNTRSTIFQLRLAPIQVSYLGYPGSMGTPYLDYIIADPTVIPIEHYEHYSEKVISLPHSYQPNDNLRKISEIETTRPHQGLPDDGFVFCSFNNSYKISPAEFDIWMRLLKNVEGSVLWLLNSNKWVKPNLEREAINRGIDPNRLVFAKKTSQEEHLARHRHADLFLDTFNCNAHTTASDALYAGLPVVTKIGEQFASRVAASLLVAVGLPELVTSNKEEYEKRIMELATAPAKLDAIKKKLRKNIETEPLFDTERYTKNFEQGLLSAYALYLEGNPPRDIFVTENSHDQ